MYNSDKTVKSSNKNPNNSNKTALNSEQKEDKTRRKQLAKERGARLKQALRARGLTMTHVANDLQRSVSSISILCSGRTLISPTFAFAIEHLYCLASEYVLSGKGGVHVTHTARELVNMGTIRDLELEYKRSDTLRILLDNCESNVMRLKICCEKKKGDDALNTWRREQ